MSSGLNIGSQRSTFATDGVEEAMRAWLAALMVATVPGMALAADQFDLVCAGRNSGSSGVVAEDRHYRIDLTAARWCEGDCVFVREIQEVSADNLVLMRIKRGAPLYSEIDHTISRQTGVVMESTFMTIGNSTFTGTCQPAPFSGLPVPKF